MVPWQRDVDKTHRHRVSLKSFVTCKKNFEKHNTVPRAGFELGLFGSEVKCATNCANHLAG